MTNEDVAERVAALAQVALDDGNRSAAAILFAMAAVINLGEDEMRRGCSYILPYVDGLLKRIDRELAAEDRRN